jgi:hypothetical protein
MGWFDGLSKKVTAVIEMASKPQIRFKGKASGRSGKRSIRRYVSIYRRTATQPLGLRWGFETISRNAPVFEHRLVALDIGKWSWCHWQMIPHAKLESAGC